MTLVRLLHAQNAASPIVVTLSGIVTLVRLLHAQNAAYPIAVISPSNLITQQSLSTSYLFDTIFAPKTVKLSWLPSPLYGSTIFPSAEVYQISFDGQWFPHDIATTANAKSKRSFFIGI